MMPTFPSTSLNLRTVGFPQHGFKAGLSEGASLEASQVKPAPGIPWSTSPSLGPGLAMGLALAHLQLGEVVAARKLVAEARACHPSDPTLAELPASIR